MDTAGPGEDGYWVRSQLATTMDVDCYPWLDWFHGGLQFQVVHHLFCRLPRHNLRYVRDTYVLPLAKKQKVKYLHMPWIPAI